MTLLRPAPCYGCPFTTGSHAVRPDFLDDHRREAIAASMLNGVTFNCHVAYYDEGRTEQCAGAAVVLDREGMPNQIMRIHVRLGGDPVADPGYDLIPWDSMAEWVNQ